MNLCQADLFFCHYEQPARTLNRRIDLLHQPPRLRQRETDAPVMVQVVERERAASAIFQPFLHRLVAADPERPYFRRYARKVLAALAGPAIVFADVDSALI